MCAVSILDRFVRPDSGRFGTVKPAKVPEVVKADMGDAMAAVLDNKMTPEAALEAPSVSAPASVPVSVPVAVTHDPCPVPTPVSRHQRLFELWRQHSAAAEVAQTRQSRQNGAVPDALGVATLRQAAYASLSRRSGVASGKSDPA